MSTPGPVRRSGGTTASRTLDRQRPPPVPEPTPTRTATWAQLYRRRLLVTDTVVVVLCMFGAQGLRDQLVSGAWWESWEHTSLSLLVSLGWLLSLHAYGSRSSRVIGVGSAEFHRIVGASIRVFGLFAIWALLARNDLGRGYLLVAMPLGMTLLIVGRLIWRGWLRRRRRVGQFCHSVVLLGSPGTAVPVANDLARNITAGYRVLGLVLSDDDAGELRLPRGVPVLGGLDDVVGVLERVGADTVVVTGSSELSPDQLRTLGWQLEDERYNLVFTPSLSSVGGPRVHMSPVAGLSLLHVDTPRYEGIQRFQKRALDLVGALGLLMVLGLPMLVVALLIKLSSPGPVLYRQERIGRDGQPFSMVKFRSMRQGADAELAALLAAQQTDGAPLFKVADDPRITRIGRFLRKYSVDEVPQLFNVVRGEMSLVGPRPQVADEVALYDEAAHRRHRVQPGMTGLWQVSGRSSLDWEDAISLDLHYVANWSVTTDLGILLRTFRAVVAPGDTAH